MIAGSLHVRVAVPSDADTVTDILGRSYPQTMAAAYPPEVLELLLPIICRANPTLLAAGTFYLAERGGTALGCGGWSAEQPGTGGREEGVAHVRHFAVLAEALGQGAGKALFRRCAHDASILGFRAFEVYSTLNAEGFYAAMGFEGIEQMNIPMPGGVAAPAIRMRRTIS